MTRPDDLVAMAADLGHCNPRIEPTESGARWACSCSCGWGQPRYGVQHPVTRATKREAARSVIAHLTTAVQRYLSNCLRDGIPPRRIRHHPVVT